MASDAPKPWADVPLTGRLVLADGTVIAGQGLGADRVGGRRGVLQHRDDRLSGDPDRSLLRRPDHHLHLPAYRQCRHQPRGHGDLNLAMRSGVRGCVLRPRSPQPSNFRAAETLRPWLKARRHHRHHRRRHARAHARASARRACPTASSRTSPGQVRPRGAQGRGAGPGRAWWAWTSARGDRRPELQLGRDPLGLGQGLRPAGRRRLARRGHRLWRQAQHPAQPRDGRAAG